MGNVKFLNKTFRIYWLCSIAVLLIAAPVFYYSMVRLYIKDTDETLMLYKKEFEHYYLPNLKRNEIENYNRYNRDIKILPKTPSLFADSLFYQTYLDTLDNENEPYRVLISPISIEHKPYTLFARISLVESEDLMKSIGLLFFVLIALLLLVLLIFTNSLSRKIWRPFKSTLEKLKSFDLTAEKAVSFDSTNIIEFKELNRALQKLIEKNISTYKKQKVFIENASHELQTPLAVLKSKLDLLIQNKDLTKEQSKIISAIELPLSRVSRINKNLLLLAKIENNQFANEDRVEITGLIDETLELLTDYIAAKKITVEKSVSEKLVLVCNKTLLEVLITNLLINAIIHNIKSGKIKVDFSEKRLVISNTGNITLDNNKLFKRFSVSSSQSGSSGLGLAIVKEIGNRYNWEILYEHKNGMHILTCLFDNSEFIQN